MTFHVGQAVVCVDASIPWCPKADRLTKHAIYRIAGLLCEGEGVNLVGVANGDAEGWRSERFRPLVHDDDNAELIERIKNCRPARTPQTISAAHTSHAAQAGSEGAASHGSALATAQTGNKSGDHLINQCAETNSFHAGEQ